MKRTLGVLTTGAITAGLLAIPAAAGATPVLAAPLAKCYAATPPNGVPQIPVSISGGTAGDQYILEMSDPKGGVGSLGSTEGTFDANGNGTSVLKDVYGPKGLSIDPSPGKEALVQVTETMADGTQPVTEIGTTLFTENALDLGNLNARKPHTVAVSGTMFANKPLYAFIVHRGKVVKRISMGRANVCGYAHTKVQLLSNHTPEGKYLFYVNAGKTLNKKASMSKGYTIQRF